MKTKLIILSIAALCLSAAPVMAATFSDGGTALQGVLDGITVGGPSSVTVTTDELAEGSDAYWQIGGSGGAVSTMIIELAGWANTTTFGVYDASNPNTKVQLFDGAASTGSKVTLGIFADGSVTLSTLVTGANPFGDTGIDFAAVNNFGFYLDASIGNGPDPGDGSGWDYLTAAQIAAGMGIMYSDSSLNPELDVTGAPDPLDHMYAYQGVDDQIQILPWAAGPWSANEYVLAWEDSYDYMADSDFTDFVVIVESVSPVPVPGAVLLGILGLSAAGIKLRRFA